MSRYPCPIRWADLDAQGHLNNAAYVDYLQEARVHFLLAGPPALQALLSTGVLVVGHQVEYLQPVTFTTRTLDIDLWVDSVGGSRFGLGYELFDGATLIGRARTALVPFDLATDSLRRLTGEERALLSAALVPAEPLRPVPDVRWNGGDHVYPLRIRWSDLDSYGHANNVKYYDYIQEARIALMTASLGWPAEDGAANVWLVVRQDLDYRKPLDFREAPYEVGTVISQLGNRSITLAAEIRDRPSGTVYASARTILVGRAPLTDDQRMALGPWLR